MPVALVAGSGDRARPRAYDDGTVSPAPPASNLSGRLVVVTGGAGALGSSVVAAFVRAGAVVHVPVHGPAPAPGTPGVTYAAGVNLTDEAAVVAFYAGLPGALWASVHLAGGFAMSAIADTRLADLRAQLDLNLVTTFLCCREAVRRIRQRGDGAGGRIVNVAARTALRPEAHKIAYGAAKAAVVSMTAALGDELRAEGVAVNAVAPGTIDTPANRAAMPDADRSGWVAPDALAALILTLTSPDLGPATGATIPVF